IAIRTDKTPDDCWASHVDEPPCGTLEEAKPAPPTSTSTPSPGRRRGVKVTNRDKVFWPDDGYTKGDLVDYYVAVAPRLLPYLENRPVVLTRYPDGMNGKSFFQKDAPEFVPDWLRLET